jgi:hypothetical protein
MLAASLRCFGGALADAPVIVTVSRDVEPYDLAAALPWSAELGIEWRWIDAGLWAEHGIYATALSRFTHDFDAEHVLQLDADVVCAAPLDELLLVPAPAIAAAVAHVSPAYHGLVPHGDDAPERDGERFWRRLYDAAALPAPEFECEHPGAGIADEDPSRRLCPPYFNLGVLMASAEVTRRLGEAIFAAMAAVEGFVDTHFRCQLALTLAIERTRTPFLELPLRWNFPDHVGFWSRFPGEAADLRLLHYCYGNEHFERGRDTERLDAVAAFAARPGLDPVHALLADRMRAALTEPAHA